MRIWRSRSVRGLSLTLLCLLAVIYPLFAGPGPINTRGGGDSPFLLIRLEQLTSTLRAGAFPARWMPDAAYGLGYPFFNFYAALPYYVAAAFRFLGWGPILSLQVTQALGFVLSAAAMYLLARRVFRHPAAVALAVIAYTAAPFHLVNVYVRGDSLSEFYAFVFYPLVFWALLRLCSTCSLQNVAWLALACGGLLLTHNLSALIFGPFLAAFALLLLWPARRPGIKGEHRLDWRMAGAMVGAGLLGLALAATLYLTALTDLGGVWMGVKDIQTSGFFDYAAQFRGRDLIQPTLAFDYEVSGPTPFSMGLVQGAAILAGVIVLVVGWVRRPAGVQTRPGGMAAFWLAGFAVSTLMITPLSSLLWDVLPVLPIVQFPWRFLSVQAFFGALIVGQLAERLPRPWWVAAGGALLLTAAAVGGLRPEYLAIHESDVSPERLSLFETFTTNIGTTIRGEYLPVAVEPRPWSSAVMLNRGQKPPPMVLAGRVVRASLAERDAVSERWQIGVASDEARLAFHTLYFAGWQAYREEAGKRQRLEIEPLPNSGLILVRLPRGEHTIALRLERTPIRWIADLISLAAAAGVLALLWPQVRALGHVPWSRISAALGGGFVLLGALTVLGGMLSSPWQVQPTNDLSMDFDRMPMLHHNPHGIDFGRRARLDSYDCAASVRGGEVLTVTLTWAQQDPHLVADLRLVSPANAHRDLAPAPPPLASARAYVEGSKTQHALPIPADTASGLYYLALRTFDGEREIQALSARGDSLGTTYLRPVWVVNPRPAGVDDRALARFGDRILLRDNVRVSAQGGYWDVALTWQATAPIPLNYTCSLRMLDAGGRPVAQRDFEGGPGYGFWPTLTWPVGEWLTDRLRIAIPPQSRAEDAVALSVVLYDRSQEGFPAAGTIIVPLVEREHRYDPPMVQHPVGAEYGEQIRLLGYDLAQGGTSLRLTLHWQAAARMADDYAVFVHLFDPATEEIVVQSDARPLNGAYPTNWWREGEVVSDPILLALTDVPEGRYRLAIGLYNVQGDRLTVVRASGGEVPGSRLILEQTISIPHSSGT